ncbi:acyltransferase (plasmid) [Azospirillum melinis]|uniref:acyltransferase n=1 Tax=Azospirillum melinis TaxID=328839 RepID=UPI0037581E6B
MAIEVIDQGKNNRIEVSPEFLSGQNGIIKIYGDDNSIKIGNNCLSRSIFWEVGSSCKIDISDRVYLSALTIYLKEGASVSIGKGTGFTWKTILQAHEAKDISIGEDCLFASDTRITVSDMHSIMDRSTGKRINHAKSILIDDHVWISDGVLILKGATVGTGSVIGAKSVVTRAIPPYTLAVGAPAKVIKSNISWTHDLIQEQDD